MWRPTLGVLAVLAVVPVAACSEPAEHPDDGPSISKRLQELDPAEPVKLAAAKPDDARDPDDVAAALWAIDPCALVPDDLSDDGRTLDSVNPHACAFRYRGRQPLVQVGMYLSENDRHTYEATGVAGVKVYQTGGGLGDEYCGLKIPVSPTHAIEIEDSSTGEKAISCAVAERVAAYAIRQIRTGHTGATPLPDTPDTCSVLSTALGRESNGLRFVYGGPEATVDTCAALSTVSPGNRLVSATYARLSIGDAPIADARPHERINGQRVNRTVRPSLSTYRSQCTMRWTESATLSVRTSSCARTRTIVERVMASYDGPARPTDDPPRLRFYRPGEPDREGVGACRDYVSLVEYSGPYDNAALIPPGPGCHPYRKVDLADDPAELLRDAEADPNVTCALARAAVKENVTSDMTPVTLESQPPEVTGRHPIHTRPCVFVDGHDRSQILIVASTEPIPKSLAHNSKDPLASHPVQDLRFAPDPGPNARLATASQAFGDTRDDPGYLTVMVGPDPPYDTDISEVGMIGSDESDRAAAILNDIVNEHFEEAS